MNVPTVAELEISGAFTVIDIDTGETLHKFTAAPDESGDISPESCFWPVVAIMARNDTLVIMTRPPKPDPRDVLRRTQEEYIRKQTASPSPGSRRLW